MKRITTILSVLLVTASISAQIKKNENLEGRPVYNSPRSESETCYCFEYYSDPNAWLNAHTAIQNNAYNEFYRAQREVIKQEIEDRLNKTFSNYEDAVKKLFNEKMTNEFASNFITNRIEADKQEIRHTASKAQASRDKFRLFEQLIYNTGNVNMFGGLRHNNKLLTSMSSGEANNLANEVYYGEETQLWNRIDYLESEIGSLFVMRSNNAIADYNSDLMWSHHKQYSDYNEIRQISGYLVYFAQRDTNPLFINHPGLFDNLEYLGTDTLDFYTNSELGSLVIQNLGSYSSGYIMVNNLIDVLKFNYSTENENIGFSVGNYLKNNLDLRDAARGYMQSNNYSQRSIYNAKDLIQSYISDDALDISSNLLDGSNISLQTADRPDRIFLMNWKSDALALDYGNIGSVLEQLSLVDTNQEQEGILIKRMLNANFSGNVPNGIDYGKIFDFTYTANRIGIQFSPYALSHIIGDLEHADGVYGWDLFVDPFKIGVLQTISNGGYGDFEDKITNSLSSKERCLNDFLNQSGNRKISHILSKFSGASEFSINIESSDNVIFINPVTDETYEVNAKTSYLPNNIVNIQISTSRALSRPSLAVVRTIIHEYIHAEIYRSLNTNNPTQGDLNFREIYNSYDEQNFEPTQQHQTMAQLYVDVIANALSDYHQNILTEDYEYLSDNGNISLEGFYRGLAWLGLKNHNVQAYIDLSQNEKDALNDAVSQYYHTSTTTCPN